MLRTGLLMVALLGLTACWTGDPWFAASEAVAVLPDGTYRLTERGASPSEGDPIQITRQTDNSLLLEGAKNPWRAILVPLEPGDQTRFIGQLQEQDPQRPTHALFVLLETAGGRYGVHVLKCRRDAQDAAERTGGFVARDPQSAATCVFHDRTTLLNQLRAAAHQAPALDLELTRQD